MKLTTRFYGPDAKGSKLSIKEMDDNLYYLQGLGVSGVTFEDNILTLTDPTGGTKSVTINTVEENQNNLTIKINNNVVSTGATELEFLGSVGGGSSANGAVLTFDNTIEVNGISGIRNLNINPVSSNNYSGGGRLTLNIDTYEPSYKTYRAKIATQSIDWAGYGYLYNAYVTNNVRGLANPAGGTGLINPNQWRVPTSNDMYELRTYIGISGSSIKLKSKLTYTGYPFYGWTSNAGTDDYNFNALPGGWRLRYGDYGLIGQVCAFRTNSTEALLINGPDLNITPGNNWDGYSVRLIRNATPNEILLNDGDTSDTSSLDPYTGNDGKTYVTVKIGTQIWLAQNLRETKYNDNSVIFNASVLGGDSSNSVWEQKGINQEDAYTVYLYTDSNGTSSTIEYNPIIIRKFYNDVLENTLESTPEWTITQDVNGPIYNLFSNRNSPWNKTHIKITPSYDVSDFPIINERSLLIERSVEGENQIKFRPIKKDNTGSITIENLNNYSFSPISYIYVEILEYPINNQSYNYSYYGFNNNGIGINNL